MPRWLTEEVGEKGLKSGALGLISSVVVGVASTAPAYSLAATLGFVVIAINGLQAPIITILAFVPMLFISYAYKEMNNADPDCGTTFTWGARAFGPKTGWLGGWGIVAADILVMASLAQIAGQYVFLLFGADGIGTNADQRLGAPGRHPLDRRHDGDLLRRHRDLGQLAKGAARHRADHAARVLDRGAGEGGLRPRARSGTSRPSADVVQPLPPPLLHELHGRVHPDAVHLLGVGHLGLGQRGDQGLATDPGPGRGALDRDPAGDLRPRGHGHPVLRRHRHEGHRPRQPATTPAT